MTAEIRLRELEASLRVAQARAAEKRRAWNATRIVIHGEFADRDAYDAFMLASVAYASTADEEAGLFEQFEEARIDAQAEQIRLEQERQTA